MSSFSSNDVLRALGRAGFTQVSHRGSHLKLRRESRGVRLTVIVPHPKGDIPNGTLGSILRQAAMTRDQFNELLR